MRSVYARDAKCRHLLQQATIFSRGTKLNACKQKDILR